MVILVGNVEVSEGVQKIKERTLYDPLLKRKKRSSSHSRSVTGRSITEPYASTQRRTRLNEAAHLTWSDVDFDANTLRIIAKPEIAGVAVWRRGNRRTAIAGRSPCR